jgi:hypothetical protein
MSENRLDRGLQEMKDEVVDAATLASARSRVWDELASASNPACAEFRQDFRAYLNNGT